MCLFCVNRLLFILVKTDVFTDLDFLFLLFHPSSPLPSICFCPSVLLLLLLFFFCSFQTYLFRCLLEGGGVVGEGSVGTT